MACPPSEIANGSSCCLLGAASGILEGQAVGVEAQDDPPGQEEAAPPDHNLRLAGATCSPEMS